MIPQPLKPAIIEPVLSIKEAFAYALKIKKKSLNDTSYMNFEGRINRFKKALDENAAITSLNRKQTNLNVFKSRFKASLGSDKEQIKS